jgi:hypothetical protein
MSSMQALVSVGMNTRGKIEHPVLCLKKYFSPSLLRVLVVLHAVITAAWAPLLAKMPHIGEKNKS